ncbi:MAG: lmo0937 family membrane protein [Gemmatimonadota bacterium]
MLQTIAIVLIVLWALGLVGGYAIGGFIHLLLVIAIVMLAIRFFTGRRVV